MSLQDLQRLQEQMSEALSGNNEDAVSSLLPSLISTLDSTKPPTGKRMNLITPEYQRLQSEFHLQRPDYGVSSGRHCDNIIQLAQALNTRDILDYGCGKAALQKGIPWPIQNYDPCMEEYLRRPKPATIVVCTDVLEHIEIDCLAAVLDDLRTLTGQALFVNVACRPAKKVLQDGRNAHLIQESPNWWLSWLLPRFNLQSFQATKGDFTALLTALGPVVVEPSHD